MTRVFSKARPSCLREFGWTGGRLLRARARSSIISCQQIQARSGNSTTGAKRSPERHQEGDLEKDGGRKNNEGDSTSSVEGEPASQPCHMTGSFGSGMFQWGQINLPKHPNR